MAGIDDKPSFSNTMSEQAKARLKAKMDRRTQDIREQGDKWLAKLAQMPRNSGKRYDPNGDR